MEMPHNNEKNSHSQHHPVLNSIATTTPEYVWVHDGSYLNDLFIALLTHTVHVYYNTAYKYNSSCYFYESTKWS